MVFARSIYKPWRRNLPLIALILLKTQAGQACQYCRMAATDPEAARMAAQMHAGGFPLDATLNSFQPTAPAAVLTAPPDPGGVATRVADLPPTSRPVKVGKPAIPPASKLAGSTANTAPVQPVAAPSAPARTPWADAGLLGLLSLGGWFCWRTRRVSAPVD